MLLQKSDGSFQLVVWDERLQGEDSVTVTLGEMHDRIVLYDPTLGTEPVKTIRRARSVQLTLSNHPVVLVFARAAHQ
jgi:hypothetical protein